MKISNSVTDKSSLTVDAYTNKDAVTIDTEDHDVINEYISPLTESERAAKKVAARKKIELYWEKKRLQEQLGEYTDEDLDF
jgi:hypothetical protein